MMRLQSELTAKVQSKHAKVTDRSPADGIFYDIICCIKQEMQNSNICVNFRHGASHQDDVKAFDDLDEWEKPTIGLTDMPRMPFGSTWRRVVQE